MRVECPGIVDTDSVGAPLCSDGAGVVLAWVPVGVFDPADIDLAVGSAAFAAGFFIVGMTWAIGRGVRVVLSMLR